MRSTALVQTAAMSRRDARAARRRRFSAPNVVVAIVLFAGVGTVLYPTAAAWFSDRTHATEVSGYISEVTSASSGELQNLLDSAFSYNADLPDGPLRDPYTLSAGGTAQTLDGGRDEYDSQLRIAGTNTMARIRIPEIGVDLPIYHGTEAATLERGVGHLFGSSLPVGGAGTHAVLTGHNGLPSATLFTNVSRLERGDLFYVDVAGEVLTYRIAQILTVMPDDGESLRRTPGHDYVTLLTCTPTGINTHRLLVRGERVDDSGLSARVDTVAPNVADPGFPWWVLALVSAGAASIAVAWPRRQRHVSPSAPRASRPTGGRHEANHAIIELSDNRNKRANAIHSP